MKLSLQPELPPRSCLIAEPAFMILTAGLAMPAALRAESKAERNETGFVVVKDVRNAALGVDDESVSTLLAVSSEGLRTAGEWTVPDAVAPGKSQIGKAETFTRAENPLTARRIILWQRAAASAPGEPLPDQQRKSCCRPRSRRSRGSTRRWGAKERRNG